MRESRSICSDQSAMRASSRSCFSRGSSAPAKMASWIVGASSSNPIRCVTRGWLTSMVDELADVVGEREVAGGG